LTQPSSSESLAAFAADLDFRNLPRAVIAGLERHLLDTIGVALASSPMPFARSALDAVGKLSDLATRSDRGLTRPRRALEATRSAD